LFPGLDRLALQYEAAALDAQALGLQALGFGTSLGAVDLGLRFLRGLARYVDRSLRSLLSDLLVFDRLSKLFGERQIDHASIEHDNAVLIQAFVERFVKVLLQLRTLGDSLFGRSFGRCHFE